jgi:uncharacterized Zn-binding protein involved in type VI secretion
MDSVLNKKNEQSTGYVAPESGADNNDEDLMDNHQHLLFGGTSTADTRTDSAIVSASARTGGSTHLARETTQDLNFVNLAASLTTSGSTKAEVRPSAPASTYEGNPLPLMAKVGTANSVALQTPTSDYVVPSGRRSGASDKIAAQLVEDSTPAPLISTEVRLSQLPAAVKKEVAQASVNNLFERLGQPVAAGATDSTTVTASASLRRFSTTDAEVVSHTPLPGSGGLTYRPAVDSRSPQTDNQLQPVLRPGMGNGPIGETLRIVEQTLPVVAAQRSIVEATGTNRGTTAGIPDTTAPQRTSARTVLETVSEIPLPKAARTEYASLRGNTPGQIISEEGLLTGSRKSINSDRATVSTEPLSPDASIGYPTRAVDTLKLAQTFNPYVPATPEIVSGRANVVTDRGLPVRTSPNSDGQITVPVNPVRQTASTMFNTADGVVARVQSVVEQVLPGAKSQTAAQTEVPTFVMKDGVVHTVQPRTTDGGRSLVTDVANQTGLPVALPRSEQPVVTGSGVRSEGARVVDAVNALVNPAAVNPGIGTRIGEALQIPRASDHGTQPGSVIGADKNIVRLPDGRLQEVGRIADPTGKPVDLAVKPGDAAVKPGDQIARTCDAHGRCEQTVARNGETVARNGETIARNGETIARNGETIARNGETIARNGETIARNGETVARNGETIARNGETIARNGETIARNGETVARNGETIARNGETVARNGETVARSNDPLARSGESLVRTADGVVKPGSDVSTGTANSAVKSEVVAKAEVAAKAESIVKADGVLKADGILKAEGAKAVEVAKAIDGQIRAAGEGTIVAKSADVAGKAADVSVRGTTDIASMQKGQDGSLRTAGDAVVKSADHSVVAPKLNEQVVAARAADIIANSAQVVAGEKNVRLADAIVKAAEGAKVADVAQNGNQLLSAMPGNQMAAIQKNDAVRNEAVALNNKNIEQNQIAAQNQIGQQINQIQANLGVKNNDQIIAQAVKAACENNGAAQRNPIAEVKVDQVVADILNHVRNSGKEQQAGAKVIASLDQANIAAQQLDPKAVLDAAAVRRILDGQGIVLSPQALNQIMEGLRPTGTNAADYALPSIGSLNLSQIISLGERLQEAVAGASNDSSEPQPKPQLQQHRTKYLVKEGDTLESIAQEKLGDSRLFPLLITINRALVNYRLEGERKVAFVVANQYLWLPTDHELEIHKRNFFGKQGKDGKDGSISLGISSKQNTPIIPPVSFDRTREVSTEVRANIQDFRPSTNSGTVISGPVSGSNSSAAQKAQSQESGSKMAGNVDKVRHAGGRQSIKLDEIEFVSAQVSHRQCYQVREGETLLSIAASLESMGHISMWKLLAKINGFQIKEDGAGKPVENLFAGQFIVLPTAEELNEFKLLEKLTSCSKNATGTTNGAAAGAVLNAFSCVLEPKQIAPEPPRALVALAQGIGGLTTVHKLSNFTRLVLNDLPQLENCFSITVEARWNGQWKPMASYECRHGQTTRHLYSKNGEIKSMELDLPPHVVKEMAREDFVRNWNSYVTRYMDDTAERRA